MSFFLLMLSLPCHAELKLPSALLEKLAEQNRPLTKQVLVISTVHQKLVLFEEEKAAALFDISTAKNGLGEDFGSFKTPVGLHRVSKKIGKGASLYTIFIGRVATKNTWEPSSPEAWKNSDLVLSRILWLEGLEPGVNLGKAPSGRLVDTASRYIYIHGTNHEDLIGKPCSKGCIRMRNSDIVRLFDQVKEGSLVYILGGFS